MLGFASGHMLPKVSFTYFGLIDQLPWEVTCTSAGRTMGTVPL
jgi:hypothetical protein